MDERKPQTRQFGATSKKVELELAKKLNIYIYSNARESSKGYLY